MPIEMKCTNASCTTVMAVKEEHVGRSVKCPACGTVSVVPAASTAPPPPAPVAAGGTPLPPEAATPGGANLIDTIKNLCKDNNLDDLSAYALGGGMFALAVLILCIILPPYSIMGALLFVVNVGVTAFVLVSFVKMHVFFDKALFAAAGWGAFVFMVFILMMLMSEVGIGSYLGLLASIGVAGAFGYLSYLRLMKKA